MLKKFLRICFISNILLACLLQISCLHKNQNTKSNLQSSKSKEITESKEEHEHDSTTNKTEDLSSTGLSTSSSSLKLKPKLEKKHFKPTHRRCGHDILPKPKLIPNRMYSDLSTEKFAETYSNAEWAPIRIYVDFSKLESQTGEVPSEKIDTLKKIIIRSKEILEKLLKVKRLTKRLIPGDDSNGQVSFSQDVKTKGVEADLLLSVEFSKDVTGSTIATANALEYEEKSGRPVIGRVQYNKSFEVKKNAIKGGIGTAIHEIAHVLVFNSDYYEKFINPATLEKIPKDRVIKETKVNGEPRKLFITPNVVKAARKHFGCDKLEGVELENQGGDGTAYSHWEERLMLGDFMIGEDGAENVISEITLGVFDDSGWYQTNPYTGGLFVFGLNQGCAFIEENCAENGVTKFKNDFCVGSDESNCDSSHRQRTICGIKTFDKEVPTNYKHFADPKLGGTQPLSDYCPIPVKNSDKADELRNNCNFGQKNETTELAEFETIGPNSACFVSNFYNKSNGSYKWTSGKGFSSACYEYKCNDAERIVEVSLGGKFFKCPRQGGSIEVEVGAVKGTVHCMDYNLVCNQTIKCNSVYECAMKESKRKEEMTFDYQSKTIGSGSSL